MKNLKDYSTQALKAELERREHKIKTNSHKELIKLKINNITTQDFKIYYFQQFHDKEYHYSFFLMKDNKEYCIYYDFNNAHPQDWWPHYPEEDNPYHHNRAFEFVPDFLTETAENYYESKFDLKTTLKKLKQCGFKKIEFIEV